MRQTVALTCLICLLHAAPSAAVDPASASERAEARVDLYGDPLPAGAIARLGSVRLRSLGIASVAFSPDGRVLASGGGAIRFWDLSTGRMLREFPTGVSVIAFSPDGTRLATGESAGTVRLWDVSTGRQVFANERVHITDGKLPELVNGVAWSPDGSWFASVSGGNEIHLWNAADGSRLRSLTISDKRRHAYGFALSPDGSIIAVSCRNEIQLWDLRGNQEPKVIEQAHAMTVVALAFTPDGRRLVSAGYGNDSEDGRTQRFTSEIRVWDPTTGDRVSELWNAESEPDSPRSELVGGLAVSRDGTRVVSMHAGELRFWEFPSGELTDVIRNRRIGGQRTGPQDLALSPDGRLIATTGGTRAAHLWETDTGRERFASPGAHEESIRTVAWSLDGGTIGTASFEGTVCLWDPATGRLKHELIFSRESTNLYALALSPDGRLVAATGDYRVEGSSDREGGVKLWDVRSGQLIREIRLVGQGTAVAFSPDGRRLAACAVPQGPAGDGPIKDAKPLPPWEVSVFDIDTGDMLFRAERVAPSDHLAFTSDGESLLFSKQVMRWDFTRGKAPQALVPHIYSIGTITAISTDGRWLGLTHWNQQRQELVDLSTGTTVWERPAGPGRIFGYNALEFSNDSRLLMARGPADEGEHVVLEVRTGQVVRRFPSTTSTLTAVAFSPDGTKAVIAQGDGNALVWDLRSASGRAPQKPSTEKAWDDQWDALADPDAGRAYDAVWTLSALGADAVEFLGRRLKPAAAPDQDDIERLIVALDDADYETRRDASRDLRVVARMVQKQLRKASENPASAELRKRIEALLAEAQNPLVSLPEEMRSLRAIQILDDIGGSEARHVLQTLSQGAPGAIETEESKAALARWSGP